MVKAVPAAQGKETENRPWHKKSMNSFKAMVMVVLKMRKHEDREHKAKVKDLAERRHLGKTKHQKRSESAD